MYVSYIAQLPEIFLTLFGELKYFQITLTIPRLATFLKRFPKWSISDYSDQVHNYQKRSQKLFDNSVQVFIIEKRSFKKNFDHFNQILCSSLFNNGSQANKLYNLSDRLYFFVATILFWKKTSQLLQKVWSIFIEKTFPTYPSRSTIWEMRFQTTAHLNIVIDGSEYFDFIIKLVNLIFAYVAWIPFMRMRKRWKT